MNRFLHSLCGGLVLLLASSSFSHDLGGERILRLDSIQEVRRDGQVEIEYSFRLVVEGEKIQRGPVLNFITAFKGPGGLVLNNRIEVLGISRNGKPEDYRESTGEGIHQIYLGREDVLLEHGVHEYSFRCVMDGEWVYRNGEAIGSFDVGGPFRGLAIDSARLILRFPDSIQLSRYSPVVHRSIAKGIGYESRQSGNELIVTTTGALEPDHAFLVNVIWPARGFAKRSQWIEVLKQHPRLPITAVVAILLLWILFLVLGNAWKERHVRPVAA